MFYVPLAQNVNYTSEVMQRIERASHFIGGLMLVTAQSPGALEPLVTKAIAEVDPNLTLLSVRTMTEQVALSFDQDRAVASLAGLFGVVSLVLAAVGLYGVTSYSVAQRTNEIGVRMALGADRGRVIGLVLRSAFARVALGLLLGVPLAVGAGRLIAARLYGVSFWDPIALAGAAGALLVCALIASLIPAGRASTDSAHHRASHRVTGTHHTQKVLRDLRVFVMSSLVEPESESRVPSPESPESRVPQPPPPTSNLQFLLMSPPYAVHRLRPRHDTVPRDGPAVGTADSAERAARDVRRVRGRPADIAADRSDRVGGR